jgi:hypothetical protein
MKAGTLHAKHRCRAALAGFFRNKECARNDVSIQSRELFWPRNETLRFSEISTPPSANTLRRSNLNFFASALVGARNYCNDGVLRIGGV